MKLTRKLGILLLAIWLILTGLVAVLGLNFQGIGIVMGILAIAAGVFLALEQ
jgi:hypothetical protein